MGRFGTVLVAVALTTPLSAALAADLSGEFPPPAGQAHPQFFDLSGWYLRADAGYAWGRLDGVQAASGYLTPADNGLGEGFIASVGGGIKTHWLRTDVTLDYTAPLTYSGSAATAGDVTAKISAWSALVNGYVDLGTWYGVTPYVGAGAGVGYVTAADYASAVSPPFAGGDHSQWNFNWAAMAGLGYAISPRLALDVGYRYLNFGDVKSASDAFGEMIFNNVAAHEVRVGVRWKFDNALHPN